MPVNRRKDNFYSDTDDHRRYIDRKIVDETVNEAAKEVGRAKNSERGRDAVNPVQNSAVPSARPAGQEVRLIADIVNSKYCAGNQRVNDGDHHAFEVVAVADVNGPGRLFRGTEKERVGGVHKSGAGTEKEPLRRAAFFSGRALFGRDFSPLFELGQAVAHPIGDLCFE